MGFGYFYLLSPFTLHTLSKNSSFIYGFWLFLIGLWYDDFRHQQYIGKVNQAVFQTPKTGRKRVVVSTEENVLASLDLRRGEICKIWSFCCSLVIGDVCGVNLLWFWSKNQFLFLGFGCLQFGERFLGRKMSLMTLH